MLHILSYVHQLYTIFEALTERRAYTGHADSKKSGCRRCSSTPQKGHNGFEGISESESVKELKSGVLDI